jgi:hypothetical protein
MFSIKRCSSRFTKATNRSNSFEQQIPLTYYLIFTTVSEFHVNFYCNNNQRNLINYYSKVDWNRTINKQVNKSRLKPVFVFCCEPFSNLSFPKVWFVFDTIRHWKVSLEKQERNPNLWKLPTFVLKKHSIITDLIGYQGYRKSIQAIGADT